MDNEYASLSIILSTFKAPFILANQVIIVGGGPVQGSGPSPEHYENLKRIADASEKLAESSVRLESGTKRLVRLTLVLVVLTIFLIGMTVIFALQQQAENAYSLHVLDEVRKYAQLTFESNYAGFKLDLQYNILPINFGQNRGGLQYEMMVTNTGKYDVEVIHKWRLERACDQNNTEIFFNTENIVTLPYKIIQGKDQKYFLSTQRIYPDLSNIKSFEFFMVVESHPTTSKGLVQDVSKNGVTRVQFDYDKASDLWIPKFNRSELICGEETNKDLPVILDTKNPEHFLSLD